MGNSGGLCHPRPILSSFGLFMYLSATTGTGRSLETKPERVWVSQKPTRSMVACRMVIRQEVSCHQIQERDRGKSGQRERVSFMVSPVLYLTESYRMDLRCPSPTWSFYTPTRLSLGYVLHREESEPESDRSPRSGSRGGLRASRGPVFLGGAPGYHVFLSTVVVSISF